MYSTLDYGIGKLRDKEDEYNSIAAAISTGLIFKSTGIYNIFCSTHKEMQLIISTKIILKSPMLTLLV